MIDFGKRGDRGLIIRQNFAIQRDEVTLSRVMPELFEAE